jgi:prephenate dehydrogenase
MKGSFTGYLNKDAIGEAEILVVCFPPKATVEAISELRSHLKKDARAQKKHVYPLTLIHPC